MRKSRLERLVHKLLGPGASPRADLIYALKQYEAQTGHVAPTPLDYLTDEGGERTEHFVAWYGRKKAAIFAELEKLRTPERCKHTEFEPFDEGRTRCLGCGVKMGACETCGGTKRLCPLHGKRCLDFGKGKSMCAVEHDECPDCKESANRAFAAAQKEHLMAPKCGDCGTKHDAWDCPGREDAK